MGRVQKIDFAILNRVVIHAHADGLYADMKCSYRSEGDACYWLCRSEADLLSRNCAL